jgi:hypothetical protein
MQGTCVPFGVYRARRIPFYMAWKYAPWVALAYAVIDREDQAEEIMSCMRELRLGDRRRMGFRRTCPHKALLAHSSVCKVPNTSPQRFPFSLNTALR